MRGTHEELILLPNGGHAFITGVKDKCDHDDKLIVYILGNGLVLFEQDYRCPTNEATMEYIEVIAKRHHTYISEGTCACSKCKKVLTLKDLMGDAFWL